ncbi:uncharacterized protein PHALS_08571 [Plasmopara halstedii]|uniref:Uncharacterized protein n=1 Tax=Plasmopara halstedii TaxID=4781 RepID=A0A0P1ACK7_PLAHL|nr:uncharacterized protein PHALS_08571 [Plasmopara halstedii]CEG38501.1 hypothetical protein PHALS_08571 [Plasmopara halstedii]|eukprot:XP_024574870.1 hypothetical protein PHALS_08571 [Plasmopara halstedii]
MKADASRIICIRIIDGSHLSEQTEVSIHDCVCELELAMLDRSEWGKSPGCDAFYEKLYVAIRRMMDRASWSEFEKHWLSTDPKPWLIIKK